MIQGVDDLFDSGEYWDRRYRRGGNSGAGSYNRLAQFKARVLNDFVIAHDVETVIEWGCGDGAQLLLAEYRSYVGLDVSRTVLDQIIQKFSGKSNYSFLHVSDAPNDIRAELALSLDVIYHLIEDDVYHRYMESLFGSASKYVIIYSSNEDAQTVAPHVRHRQFQSWIELNRPEFRLMDHVANPYPFDPDKPAETSFADFWIYTRT